MSDLQKSISNSLKDVHIGELSPGSVGRRYEPEEGLRKYRERIHKESKFADDHKNLPFTFSKPKKNARGSVKKCDNCGEIVFVTVNTVGIICNHCKQYSSVSDLE